MRGNLMQRCCEVFLQVEVIDAKSGAHLGHVFDDGKKLVGH
jgi:peptide methionine sulfoxide reductase MsrB